MLIAWLVFPLVLVLLAAGCGLLLERVCRIELPGLLVVPTGFAVIVVVGQLLTLFDATAELATPAAVVLGVLGGGPALIRRMRAIEPWALGCAAAVFLVYGAPILLSGDATFSGYIKLDDTATWMAFTDRTMEFGRNLDGLAPSSYEATLDLNLVKGYPTAIFVPWGIGAAISGQDLAWVFEPYEALLASMLALCLNAIAMPAVRSARMRALIALVAASAALLVGYSLWGGVKEVGGAMLVALVAALALLPLRDGARGVGAAVPLAFAAAALLGTLSLGAGVWLAPLLAPVAIAAIRSLGARAALGRAGDLGRPRRARRRPRAGVRRRSVPDHVVVHARARSRQPLRAAQRLAGARHLAERGLQASARRAAARLWPDAASSRRSRSRAACSRGARVPGRRCSMRVARSPAARSCSRSARRGPRRRRSRSPLRRCC